jgi:RNA polymerase sigma-70 factor (family 1)
VTRDIYLRQLFQSMADTDDKQAFAEFFHQYHSRLVQYGLLFTNSFQQAEDIVSEVLIRLLKRKNELGKIESIEGYLFLSIKNEALNQVKKSKRFQVVNDNEFDYLSSDYTDPAQKLIEDELRKLITATIENLPPKRKMVYKMVKDEGMTYKQAGDLLDISERTVEVHIKLAIKELREVIGRYLSDRKGNKTIMGIAKSILVAMAIWL